MHKQLTHKQKFWSRRSNTTSLRLLVACWQKPMLTNFIVRIVGAGLRLFMIISGVIAMFFTFIFGFIAFLIWVTLPLSVFGLVIGALAVAIS